MAKSQQSPHGKRKCAYLGQNNRKKTTITIESQSVRRITHKKEYIGLEFDF